MDRQYCVYMMTNPTRTTIYTGVTSNLPRRVAEHREKLVEGFTRRYNLVHLVWFEVCDDVTAAILREKQIKGGSRKRKIALIEALNPQWKDLSGEL